LLRLADSPVDVILSDQRMPGMTGVEFLRRAKELYPSTVRMVLSGFTELQSVIDAVNEGAVYKFLTKPWDDNRLREHVAEAFRQKELADDNRRLAGEVEQANASYASLNLKLQDSLARQSHNADILERSAQGARQILESVPAAVLGVDPDGLIVFVNEAAGRLLPRAAAAIGNIAATVLPPPLLQMLDRQDAGPRLILIDGQQFTAATRSMQSAEGISGRLIVLLAQQPTLQEVYP
jgi:CheY-like chemotaxis protein